MAGGRDDSQRGATGSPPHNPCLDCGACCVVYRSSFYWAEADDATPGGVPARLTVRVDAFRRAMRRRADGRCVALRGVPGRNVHCAIYDRRPSPCRNFEPAWSGRPAGARCGEARRRLGLAPLAEAARHSWRTPLPARRNAKALFGFTGCIFVV